MSRLARTLWLAALMATTAAPAHAIESIVTGLAYIGGLLTSTTVQGYLLYTAAALYSIHQQARQKRKARDAFNASLRDRLITVRGATEPRRVVLGRQRVGGVVAFIGSYGDNKEQLVMVIALAAHECDAIEALYFNETQVTLGGTGGEWVQTPPYARTDSVSASETFNTNGSVTQFTLAHTPIAGTVTAVQGGGQDSQTLTVANVSGALVTLSAAPAAGSIAIGYQWAQTTSYARVRTFLGAAGQTVDSVVSALFPGDWDSTHPMSGCAGVAVFLNYNEDAFQTDTNVSAVVRGAKVYDPRLDSTAGGSGPHRANDPTTWQWSENPALLVGYVATSPLLGRQTSDRVDWTRIAVAANKCDEQVDYATWSYLSTENGDYIATETGDQILA